MGTTTTKTANFETVRTQEVPHLEATYYEFRHEPTGARYIHFACADENNAFAAVIPTVPEDERGTPHILEHCVLRGGSRNYPDRRSRGVLQVLRGGAWTGWEYTWYFSASRVPQDFLKHIDIVCDYLFEPHLADETFWEEAHRLEFEDPEDPSTPLRIRGVIFNEQKGIFALPLYVTWTETCRALFPDLPYRLEHGGRSTEIPKLTVEDLREFHARHYHPANAHLLSWGNVPVDSLLETVDSALSRVPDRRFEPNPYPPLTRATAPVRHVGKLPLAAGDDPTRRGMAVMAWVTGPATDPYEAFLYEVVSEVLMGTPSSPLRTALAGSGLGRSVADTFDRFGIRYRDNVLSVGLQDMDPADADRVEQLVMDTLGRFVTEGLDDDLIDTAVNRIEFRQRTLGDAQGNEGDPVSYFIQFLNTSWVNGGDPLASVMVTEQLSRLDDERRAGRPIEDWIRRWLVDNTHRALIVLEPDPGADQRVEAEERRHLDQVRAGLSDEQARQIVERSRRLREHQERQNAVPEAPDAAALVRTPTTPVPAPVSAEEAGVPVQAYPTRTNGITYLDLFVDLGDLPDDLWDDLHLFARVITKVGADGVSPDRMAARIGAATGGLSAEVVVPIDASGDGHMRLLRLGGRALEPRQGELAAILTDLLGSADFDPGLVAAVAGEALPTAEQRIFIDAIGYLRTLAGSRLRTSSALRDRLTGFSQLRRLRALAAEGDDGVRTLASRFERIRDHIAGRGQVSVFAAVSAPETADRLFGELRTHFDGLPSGGRRTGILPDEAPKVSSTHEARTWGMSSAFNCEVLRTPGRSHDDFPALLACASMAGRWNREEIALRGTAYTAGCDGFSDPGMVTHLSTRDPNIARTYGAFSDSMRRLREEAIDKDTLAATRLEAWMVGDLPAPPVQRARRTYMEEMLGLSEEDKRRLRDRTLQITAEDVQRVASTHLKGGGVRATLASADMVSEAVQQGCAFDVVGEG